MPTPSTPAPFTALLRAEALLCDLDAEGTTDDKRRALLAQIAPFCVDPTWRVTLRVGPTGCDITLTVRHTGAYHHAHLAWTSGRGEARRRAA